MLQNVAHSVLKMSDPLAPLALYLANLTLFVAKPFFVGLTAPSLRYRSMI